LEIAPGELAAERTDYAEVVLEDPLRQALVRLIPELPPEALDDAFRKVMRAEGATLGARNRDTLLPKIASGELYVKDAHKIVEGSATGCQGGNGNCILLPCVRDLTGIMSRRQRCSAL
jgi:hypothetical protein